jgi:hypothetical protein
VDGAVARIELYGRKVVPMGTTVCLIATLADAGPR